MINTLGPFLLILYVNGARETAIAVQEMPSQAACQAAIIQLEPVRSLQAYCIAKEIQE